MTTNKNDVISQLSDYSSSSSDEFYISPEHLSPSSSKKLDTVRAQAGDGQENERRSIGEDLRWLLALLLLLFRGVTY